jgi:hypothetical protein
VDITAGDDSCIFMINKVNINMGLIIEGYGVRSGFNSRKRPPVNRASQVTLCDLEPVVTGTDGGSCNSQLSLFTVHQRVLHSKVAFFKKKTS